MILFFLSSLLVTLICMLMVMVALDILDPSPITRNNFKVVIFWIMVPGLNVVLFAWLCYHLNKPILRSLASLIATTPWDKK